MDYIIECKNVTYSYPLAEIPAIRDLNVSIERGKFYGVIGENGSGKTTFCALLRGFIPDFYKGELQGEVLVEGKKTTDYGGELSAKIGYVFQNPFTQISGVKETVFEEVAYGLENFGVPVEEIERRVVDVMQMTDIESLAEKNPFDLSGGQMRRVAIAGILAMQPDILVLDEPTAGLDPQGRKELMSLFKELHLSGMTIVLVTHLMDDVADYATAVNVMEKGQLVLSGAPKDVFQKVTFLKEKQLGVPKITEFALQLQEKGYHFESLPITIEEFVEVVSHG